MSLRVLLTMVALEDLDGEQADIATAFLHGELGEIVYIEISEGRSPYVGDEYVDEDRSIKKFTEEDLKERVILGIENRKR